MPGVSAGLRNRANKFLMARMVRRGEQSRKILLKTGSNLPVYIGYARILYTGLNNSSDGAPLTSINRPGVAK